MNENLLRELKAGTCALVLGPEFHLTNSKDEDKITGLRDYLSEMEPLKEKLNRMPMPYVIEDGCFYLRKDLGDRIPLKKKIVYAIQNYFEKFKEEVPDFYISLARMPFYLIISLSPDELMRSAFEEIKKPYDYRFFAMGEYYENPFGEDSPYSKKEIEFEPTSKRPLIFNLLGSYANWESMVFTHDSMFEFFFHLFPLEKLSQKFKTSIMNASSFLFLGFRYDKWYLKLIFFLLQKIRAKGVENVAIYTDNENFSKVKNFYADEMAFSFGEGKVDEFIKDLYIKAKQDNLTFKTPEPETANGNAAEKFKILYISSLPEDKSQIPFDREFKMLEKLYINKPGYELKHLFASTKDNMLNTIETELPHFVMISAHGNKDNELLFVDEMGKMDKFPLLELRDNIEFLVNNPRSNLQYILFNCCNSSNIAQECLSLVRHTVGMEGLMGVDASLAFSEGFFY